MACYRRFYVPGGTVFFTVRTQQRGVCTLTHNIDLLRSATQIAMRRFPFVIDSAVVLPDHLHMIWHLPTGDADFSKRWRLIKSTFSRHLPAPLERTPKMIEKGEKGIWQRRFWEHQIRDEADLLAHRTFAYSAPVRAGLCARPKDWPYSSLQFGRKMPTRVLGYGAA